MNLVLWKFSAIGQSESYISREQEMHTQLVAILEGYRLAIDLHYFDWFLRYRVRSVSKHMYA
jgi:hypothetical protein